MARLETIVQSGRETVRYASRILALGGVTTLAFLAAEVRAGSYAEETSPLQRAAAQLESRIEANRTVCFDPSYDVFWSDPNQKLKKDGRNARTNKWQFRTKVPLTKIINGQRYYFELQLKKRGFLKSAEVSPLPIKHIRVETDRSAYYHYGVEPSRCDDVEIDRWGWPVVEVEYADQNRPKIVQVARTTPYGKSIVEPPPPLPPSRQP